MHPLKEMMEKRKNGIKCGIPSYCSANELVIETILERAKLKNVPALIEATANQVNQYGGYTNMKPQDFKDLVIQIAKKTGVDENLIILGGDHLGPLIWKDETEEEAMKKADELVYEYVAAGFTKIHLDTSMKLADDAVDEMLSVETIARRGVRLYKVCIEAYEKLKEKTPEALRPVFVIGSEVPIPGGAQEKEEAISITKPEDFDETVCTYKKIFKENGCDSAWEDIVAVVVQPGVEFGDSQIFMYERKKAALLIEKLSTYPEIVFEGHSTDYQSPACLRRMVEDGIAILKVGPALTFGLRETLYGLSLIEKELVEKNKSAWFVEVLDETMIKNPENWKQHYYGNEKEVAFARKYSFSDRSRYYMGNRDVADAMDLLFKNLSDIEIPMNILHQYMPRQFEKVRDKKLRLEPKELAKDGIVAFMEEYEYASLR